MPIKPKRAKFNMSANSPTIDLAMQLMACKSVTPEDAGCQQLMIDRLEAIGFQVNNLRFDDVDNIYFYHVTRAFRDHTRKKIMNRILSQFGYWFIINYFFINYNNE